METTLALKAIGALVVGVILADTPIEAGLLSMGFFWIAI